MVDEELPELSELPERAAPAASGGAPVELIARRADQRDRRRAAVAAAVVVVAASIGAALAASRTTSDRRDVIPGPSGEAVAVGLLDGTRLGLRLPDRLGLDGADIELSGSVYADRGHERGWRLHVTRVTAEARSTARANELAITFGSWLAVVSGDSLAADDVEELRDGVELVETEDGFVEYRGSLLYWVVDSPAARLEGTDAAVSVFLRSCSKPAGATTANGLSVERVEDPSRRRSLVVVCDAVNQVEVWIESTPALTDDEVVDLGIEVRAAGATLAAIQDSRRSFECGGQAEGAAIDGPSPAGSHTSEQVRTVVEALGVPNLAETVPDAIPRSGDNGFVVTFESPQAQHVHYLIGDNAVLEARLVRGERGWLAEHGQVCRSFKDEQLVAAFQAFARDPREHSATVPFAEVVHLGLGERIERTIPREAISDTGAWVIADEEVFFRASAGPLSALDFAIRSDTVAVQSGEHAHCASPPVPAPAEAAHWRRVSFQPELGRDASCLEWWTVDLFLNPAGEVAAVTLDFWEP